MKLVLLPGMDGTGLLFLPFLQYLAPFIDAQVISYPVDRVLDYRQLQTLVEAQLPINEPFAILAESFSGPIAANVINSSPNMLRGVIFVSSFVTSPRPAIKNFIKWLPLYLFVALPPPHALSRRFLLGQDANIELLRLFHRAVVSVRRVVLAERLKMVIQLERVNVTVDCTVPILYLRATNDRLVPQCHAELVQEMFPTTSIQDISGPHFLLQAEPLACAEQIEQLVYALDLT